MRNTLLSIGLAGLTAALLSSFAFVQKSDKVQEPKKNRHVRMIKVENGKKMELDTVLVNDDVFVWNGDTISPGMHIRKVNSPGMRHFPPMPPVPPVPHVKMLGIRHQGKAIDLNDPNIISYKKTEISGNREKIEIIRKKPANNENETFNFQFDDELMAPEAPEFNWKPDGDSLRMQITRKKEIIKGKDGKEIEIKVEAEENK